MYNGSSIVFNVNYNNIHRRLAMVNIRNTERISNLHAVSMLDGV